MPQEKPPVQPGLTEEVVNRIDANSRRIRLVELRLKGIRSRIDGVEEKSLTELSSLKSNLDEISRNLGGISNDLTELRAEMLKLMKRLEKAAKKSEVKELEGLLELYSPIKSQFVTKDEIERMLEEKLGKRG